MRRADVEGDVGRVDADVGMRQNLEETRHEFEETPDGPDKMGL